MKKRISLILILASAGMMLSWFYTWNTFVLHYLSKGPIRVPESATVLALAALITAIHRSRGSRWIYVIALHGIGFFLALLLITYNVNNFPYPFWDTQWISFYLQIEKGFTEWLALITLILSTILLWFYGIRLTIITTDEHCISIRFDLGLAFFLLLLLIKLLMRYKGLPLSYDRSIGLNFVAFAVLSLSAMGLVRNKGSSLVRNITYFRGIGVILSFTLFVILFGGGLVLLCLPGMTTGAEIGYDLIRTAARPVGQILIAMLRIFTMGGCRKSPAPVSSVSDGDNGNIFSLEGDVGIVELILIWSMTILIALGGLAGIIFILQFFIRRLFRWLTKWLFAKSPEVEAEQDLWGLILQVIANLKRLAHSIMQRVFQSLAGYNGPDYFYHRLLGWGNRSGLPHAFYETPREYGSRLGHFFPDLTKEINLIVDIFNRSVYGGIAPDEQQSSNTRLSWKRLKSPMLWPARLKLLLFSSRV
ncbi:DUF4129 domain-containing protein [Thermodesulfobacteriota bacterium]